MDQDHSRPPDWKINRTGAAGAALKAACARKGMGIVSSVFRHLDVGYGIGPDIGPLG